MSIAGVKIVELKEIGDAKGSVLHVMRADAPHFTRFGEVYCSEVKNRAIKAWKKHLVMTQALSVPLGRVLFALYDDRPDSLTRGQNQTVTLGRPDAYHLLIIPPGIWYGFQGISQEISLIVNCADLVHSPEEVVRKSPDDSQMPNCFN